MTGNTVHESTRLPGEMREYGAMETYNSHEIDLDKFEYEVQPVIDKAAGEFGNPNLVSSKEAKGWNIVGPDPDGHPQQRLCARPLDHPHSVRDRRETEKKRQLTDPPGGNALQSALQEVGNAIVREGKGITLGDSGALAATPEEMARRQAQVDALRSDPAVQKMVSSAALDLAQMESE